MHTLYQELSDVSRYIQNNCHLTLEDHQPKFEDYLRRVNRFRRVDSSAEILEIGIGTGWFPILCRAQGLACKGLDISPELVHYARCFGRRYGIEPDVEVASIETYDLGQESYDVIIAASVFEHVQNWEEAMRKVYEALKPGGVLLFESTNKFSLTSGEFDFPLYGWLPDRWRYRLRIARQGPEIMNLGIDFHQFTYPLLRRVFRKLGFTQIVDRVSLADVDFVSPRKRFLVRVAKRFRLFRELVLAFASTTTFVCVKGWRSPALGSGSNLPQNGSTNPALTNTPDRPRGGMSLKTRTPRVESIPTWRWSVRTRSFEMAGFEGRPAICPV